MIRLTTRGPARFNLQIFSPGFVYPGSAEVAWVKKKRGEREQNVPLSSTPHAVAPIFHPGQM